MRKFDVAPNKQQLLCMWLWSACRHTLVVMVTDIHFSVSINKTGQVYI